MHILVIEDNPDIVANLRGFLEPLGYSLDVASAGLSGLALALNGRYDIIVLDLSLPELDGLEICRRLKHEHQLMTPILILSARDTSQDKREGYTAGASDYLVKPFRLAELNIKLRELVRDPLKE